MADPSLDRAKLAKAFFNHCMARAKPLVLLSQYAYLSPLWSYCGRIVLLRNTYVSIVTYLSNWPYIVYTITIYVFFGILIYISVHQEPSIEDYWSTKPKNPTHVVSRFMSRNRFKLFYRRFSIFDTTAEESTFEKLDL